MEDYAVGIALLLLILPGGCLCVRSVNDKPFIQLPPRQARNEFKKMPVEPVVLSPQPFQYLSAESLPKHWDWRNINGTNFVTKDLNQHIPWYCGSCWAHGALSALADRHKIQRKARWPDVNYAVQVILNCATEIAGSCYGGDPMGVYRYGHDFGIPEDTCQQYKAIDEACTPINTCKNCDPPHGGPHECKAVTSFQKHYVAEFGEVDGEAGMMKEIYARGPIACGLDCTPLEAYEGGVVKSDNGTWSMNHIISIVGWGEDEDGTKYWIGRNSWGTYWGERGWFRMERGVNAFLVETYCAWGVPTDAGPCEEGGKVKAPK